MNILSKDYLLRDLKLLLNVPEGAHKHHKDKRRIKFDLFAFPDLLQSCVVISSRVFTILLVYQANNH